MPFKKGEKVGNKNPYWKGGRRKNNAGYIQVKSYYHPFKSTDGYVMEHRLVMERWLREHNTNHPALVEVDGVKYLRPEWIPHHVNEIKDDNRIENLELMTTSDHKSFHTTGDRNPMYGKDFSEETREKMSLAKKGSKHPWYGKYLPEETCKKISEAKKGISRSEGAKGKISLTLKKYHAEREV